LRQGIKRIRQVPRLEDGNMVDTAIFDVLDYKGVTKKIQKLFGRIEAYEKSVGFDLVYPTTFVPSGLQP
jgi:acyl-[acyl-carrier-protein] desaturase